MALFDDLFFPDNQSRRNRTIQLYFDCEMLAAELKRQKEEVDAAFAEVRRILDDAGPEVAQALSSDIRYNAADQWVIAVPAVVAPLFSSVGSALGGTALAHALVGSPVALGLFANAFGLPPGFPRNQSSGPIDLKEIFGPLPGLIDGAIQRGQLRDLTKSLLGPRLKLKRVQMTNVELLTALRGLATHLAETVILLRETGTPPGVTTEALTRTLRAFVGEVERRVRGVTDEAALAALAAMDRARGSWTVEDSLG